MKGKLLVIEGIDGSGKTTQLTLLQNYLKTQKIPFETIDFPRYEKSFYGEMIARFLRGEFGPLDHINPYLISVIYALDRAEAKTEIEKWLEEGNIVISNRYATSNMAHQAGRMSKDERDQFIAWDKKLEYEVNKIPHEDLVIFLDVPHIIAQELMQNEDRKRSYTEGKDMVEKNASYLQHAEDTYHWLAEKLPHWERIDCVDAAGKLRTKEDIHTEIKSLLVKKGVIR